MKQVRRASCDVLPVSQRLERYAGRVLQVERAGVEEGRFRVFTNLDTGEDLARYRAGGAPPPGDRGGEAGGARAGRAEPRQARWAVGRTSGGGYMTPPLGARVPGCTSWRWRRGW
jgi:hypothetical protein